MTHTRHIFTLYLGVSLILAPSCNDFDKFDCFNNEEGCTPPTSPLISDEEDPVTEIEGGSRWDTSAGESFAGQITGGINAGITAGAMVNAGAMVHTDEMTAGETTAGETTAGEMTAGEMTAGEMTAGEMTAGEMTAGEMTAGEMTAGEMTAGEMTAGEMTAGEMIAECSQAMPNPFCMICNQDNQLELAVNDSRCNRPDQICQTPSNMIIGRTCYTVNYSIQNTCIQEQSTGALRCATTEDCEMRREELYSVMGQPCEYLTGCTGNEDNDVKWGCEDGQGICDQDNSCVTAHPYLNAAQMSNYRLKLCSPQNQATSTFGFLLETSVGQGSHRNTCEELCSQLDLECVYAKEGRCSDTNTGADVDDHCDGTLNSNKTCYCQPSD